MGKRKHSSEAEMALGQLELLAFLQDKMHCAGCGIELLSRTLALTWSLLPDKVQEEFSVEELCKHIRSDIKVHAAVVEVVESLQEIQEKINEQQDRSSLSKSSIH